VLFYGIVVHGFVPDVFLKRRPTAIPIPKGRNLKVTNSTNYCGMSLSLIFSKLLDLTVLSRYSVFRVDVCDLQFGFQPNRSTTMRSIVLKETM
jgi:hypothetical protein